MPSDFFITPRARLSFVQQLFTAKSFNGGKKKYGCTLLFDERARATPQYKALEAAAETAKLEKWGAKAAQMRLRSPFLDGNDYPQYAGYEGMTFLRVSTEYKPNFLTRDGQEMTDEQAEEEIYSGCFARASVNCFAYDGTGAHGNKGVSFGLRNIKKLGDGDTLGGRGSAAADFAEVEEDDEDLDAKFASNIVG